LDSKRVAISTGGERAGYIKNGICHFKMLPHDKNSIATHNKARLKIEKIAYIVLGSKAYKKNTGGI